MLIKYSDLELYDLKMIPMRTATLNADEKYQDLILTMNEKLNNKGIRTKLAWMTAVLCRIRHEPWGSY